MSELSIGYARVSTDEQDLAAQRDELVALGVRVEVDHGLTGTDRDRRGLPQVLWPVGPATRWWSPNSTAWPGRCPTRAIADELTAGEVKLTLGGAVYDPTDPVGRLLFNVLAMVAEVEADLARMAHPGGHEDRPGQGAAARPRRLSSPPSRSPTWSSCIAPASTPSASWKSCSG